MFTQTIEKTQLDSSESYQMIKDEHLASVVITSQILAGSRVLLSTYQQVVFSDCVFYACEFQGVTFENCVFENCSFEFSHIRRSEFKNCNFTNCSFKASSSTNSIYKSCDLGVMYSVACIGHNTITTQTHQEDASGLSNFNLLAIAA
jgi:uncharacterized protein YjbI with pentapeptide repeats